MEHFDKNFHVNLVLDDEMTSFVLLDVLNFVVNWKKFGTENSKIVAKVHDEIFDP